MASSIRLYLNKDLYKGIEFELRDGQFHYLRNVMRLRTGAELLFFNGNDGEFLGQIIDIHKNSVLICIKSQIRPQPVGSDLWLLFSPIKRSGTNFIVEKATELGVKRLIPVLTEYTSIKHVNLNRLNAIAIEAAEQCRRLTVPDISSPKLLEDVLYDWDQSRRLLVMDETLAMRGLIADDVARLSKIRFKKNVIQCDAILTGPEGGFSPSELKRLGDLSFVQKITLGKRILRAETAATVALGLWNELVETSE